MMDVRLHRFLGTLAACLMPLSIACAGNPPAGLTQPLIRVKMTDCSGLPCVEANTQDGKHLRLVIDTGSPSSVLSIQTAQALGLTLDPYKNSAGKAIPNVQIATVPDLRVGDGSFGGLQFLVVDLSKSVADGTFPAVDGTIGYGAFKQRLLQLDYGARLVGYSAVLHSEASCPVASCGRISFITFGKLGPPVVVANGFTVGGRPLNTQIDTMFAGSMLIYPTAVKKLGLQKQNASKAIRHFAFTDEGVDMMEAGPVDEGFLDKPLMIAARVYFAGPKVHLPDGLFDATVGAELFAGHRLNLDFAGMNVWIG